MAILDAFRDKVQVVKAPTEVQARIERGRSRNDRFKAGWNECIEFVRGNHYVYLSDDGRYLKQQATVTSTIPAKGKPNHRIRLNRNLLRPIVESKVSGATQRVPAYEILPSTGDEEAASAASLAGKIALGGYDLWNIRRITAEVVWHAVVTGEGFAMPYWDTSVGPFSPTGEEDEEGNPVMIGAGEVGLRSYGSGEVSWEPGCKFEDSPWWTIECARPIEEIKYEPGYLGGNLNPDASTKTIVSSEKSAEKSELVLETTYLERPCPKYPQGRKLVTANKRVIFPEEPYPLVDADGNVVDEPCIHRLSYFPDPASDRDEGLVKHLLDPMRTYEDTMNKISEWKNVALNPQMLAPKGSMLTRPTDAPGAVFYYELPPGQSKPPEWRQVPQIPQELFELADRMENLMGSIASQNEIPKGVTASAAVQNLLERDQVAWSQFITSLSEFHGRLMRDCLSLVQRHYTEPRLIRYRGRTSWESIDDFRGADLRGQTDVRVSPGSLEVRTKQGLEQKVMNIANMFPGHFPPEALIAAMDQGNAEKLIDSYEQDIARVARIIKLIRLGPEALFSLPPRPVFPGEDAGPMLDEMGQPIPETGPDGEPLLEPGPPIPGPPGPDGMPTELPGQPQVVFKKATEVPGWMPRPFDNIPVQKADMEDWMKSSDWTDLPMPNQEASNLYYGALLDLEAKKAQRAAELQNQMAEQQGMQNAAAPQGTKPMPSLPALAGQNKSSTNGQPQ